MASDAGRSGGLRMRKPKTMLAQVRSWMDWFIHHPFTETVVVILILVWVVGLVGEHTIPDPGAQRLLVVLGGALNVIFIIEMVIRFWVAPVKRNFFKKYYLDLIAIIPLDWVRPLRLLRLLRVGALFRRSAGELAIVAMLSLCFVLGASLVLNQHDQAVEMAYNDELGSLWFSVYTFVGGEPIGGRPLDEEGRVITLALMVGGMTLFGMFIGAVSASMTSAFTKRMEVSDMEMLDELREHLIICGWNLAGPTMLQELFSSRERPRRVVVITEQERPEGLMVAGVRSDLIHHVSGDYTKVEVLEKVKVQKASMAILLTDTLTPRSDQDRDARTVLAALTIERLNPEVFCCAELTSWEHAELLRMAGVEEIVVRDWYAGVIIGSMGRNWGLAAVLRDILSTADGNAFHKMFVRHKDEGKTIGQMHQELKENREMILIALEFTNDAGEREIAVNPSAGKTVRNGDVLVVIASQENR
ncbi:MAG: NAD-binding protein [Myxococcota bacterium]